MKKIVDFSRYIFVVTGMSYIIDSSGTSKVVKAHEEIFTNIGIGYIAIFPISRSRGEGANWHCITTGCYGFTINGNFVGVMTIKEIINKLLEMNDNGKKCIGVLVHHIIRNDFNEIEWLLERITNVPVVYYLHDFYTCCTNPNLMRNDVESCINQDISCEGCCYQKGRKEHLEKIHRFIKSIENRIIFIAPSEYTKDHWTDFYPEYKDKTVVIAHQKTVGAYKGNKQRILENEPLALGFVGAQKKIKGWNIFTKAVVEAQKLGCNYKFYYFGNGKQQIDGVESVLVDIATQGKDSMIKKLREKQIAAVFLVCVCGETYSYTTYESNAANCYILAMSTGGNIPYTVEKNNWGQVYLSENDLIQNVLNENSLRKKINAWRNIARPGAAEYIDNNEIITLFDLKGEPAILAEERQKETCYNIVKRIILEKLFIATRLEVDQ